MSEHPSLVALLSLSEGRPPSPALRELDGPAAKDAAWLFEAGKVTGGLRRLGVPGDLARVAAWWPAALLPAWRRLTAFDDGETSRTAMRVLAFYTALSAFTLFILLWVHGRYTVPSIDKMAAELGMSSMAGDMIGVCRVIAWVAVGLTVVFGLLSTKEGPALLGRKHRALARAGAICAALSETSAPREVRQEAARVFGVPAHGAATPEELDAFAARHRSIAEHIDEAVVSASRIVGPALLAIAAGALTIGIYATLAGLHP